MVSPLTSQSTTEVFAPFPLILDSRSQYRSCHILLPGEEERSPAIEVQGGYYSLVRVVGSRVKALEICARLATKGNQTAITKTNRGDVVWVLEPDALLATSRTTKLRSARQQVGEKRAFRVLEFPGQSQVCYVQVPNTNRRLAAIQVEGQYYGLFKLVKTRREAIELASKMVSVSQGIVITRTEKGEAIWVLKSDAYLVTER